MCSDYTIGLAKALRNTFCSNIDITIASRLIVSNLVDRRRHLAATTSKPLNTFCYSERNWLSGISSDPYVR